MREILTSGALSGVLDGGLVIVYVALLFFVSPALALTALIAGIATVAVIFVGAGRQRELTAQSLALEAKSQSYEVEMLTAMTTLKAMGAEQRAVGKWSSLFVDVLNLSLVRGRLGAALEALSGVVHMGGRSSSSRSARIWCSAHPALARAPCWPRARWRAASSRPPVCAGRVRAPAPGLGRRLPRIANTCSMCWTLRPSRARRAAHRVLRIEGAIALENVRPSACWPARAARRGGRLALHRAWRPVRGDRRTLGRRQVDAGLRCCSGLYRPESGRIVYDGVDLAEPRPARGYASSLGVVTQQHDVFGASIRDNIALSDPSLPMDAIVEAAKLAGLHEDIMAMPLGYQTPLIERGSSISGGQRQRLALARALRAPAGHLAAR